MTHEIHKVKVRKELPIRKEPYWGAPLARGLYLGIRKIAGPVDGDSSCTWIARLRTESGRHVYSSLGYLRDSFGFEEAKAAAVVWSKRRAEGVTGQPETVESACRRYVDNRRHEKGEATGRDAEARFERTVYGTDYGRVRLEKLRLADVQAWRDALSLGKSAANRTLASLKAALNFAVSRQLVGQDRRVAWSSVGNYREAGSRRTLFLDLTQRRSLLRAAGAGPFRDLLEAAMTTGARPGELVRLTRASFEERTKSMTFVGKTGSRTVPLSPQALALFSRLAAERQNMSDRLLQRAGGRPWGHSDWDELVKDAARASGLPSETVLYSCRHAFITQALIDGMTTLDVARLTGTSLAMIDKHYGHLVISAASERLKKVSLI